MPLEQAVKKLTWNRRSCSAFAGRRITAATTRSVAFRSGHRGPCSVAGVYDLPAGGVADSYAAIGVHRGVGERQARRRRDGILKDAPSRLCFRHFSA